MYDLTFSEQGASLRKIAELPIVRDITNGTEEGHAFSENSVVLILESIAIYWNFVDKTYVCWPISQSHVVNDVRVFIAYPPQNLNLNYKVVLTRDSVLVFHPEHLVVYEIPPQRSLHESEKVVRLSKVGNPEGIVSHRISLTHEHHPRGMAPYIGSMADWGIDDERSLPYPIHDYFNHRVETQWYSLPNIAKKRNTLSITGRTNSTVPVANQQQWLPSLEIHRRFNNGATTIAASMWELIDDGTLLEGYDGPPPEMKVFVSFSPLSPAAPSSEEPPVVVQRPLFLLTSVAPETIACDFCPLSGLLVACSESMPDRPLSIQIFDFTRPHLRPLESWPRPNTS